MTRYEKIRKVLVEHGCQDADFDWKNQNFFEAHFYNKGQLIMVRLHNNLNGTIEVFRVESFFNAGDNRSDWKKAPEMDVVLKWLGEMLERKPLTGKTQ